MVEYLIYLFAAIGALATASLITFTISDLIGEYRHKKEYREQLEIIRKKGFKKHKSVKKGRMGRI